MKYEYKVKTKEELLYWLHEWEKDTYHMGIPREKTEAIMLVIAMVEMLPADQTEILIEDIVEEKNRQLIRSIKGDK